jgi:hypothetical protein
MASTLFVCLLVAVATISLVLGKVPEEWQRKVETFNGFFADNDDGIIDSTGYPHNLYMVILLHIKSIYMLLL